MRVNGWKFTILTTERNSLKRCDIYASLYDLITTLYRNQLLLCSKSLSYPVRIDALLLLIFQFRWRRSLSRLSIHLPDQRIELLPENLHGFLSLLPDFLCILQLILEQLLQFLVLLFDLLVLNSLLHQGVDVIHLNRVFLGDPFILCNGLLQYSNLALEPAFLLNDLQKVLVA